MKILLSWSGEESRQVATALRVNLRNMIQAAVPWMSEQDLPKGSPWFNELETQLREAKGCIVCLTPKNVAEPWLQFEAGAASVALGRACVVPFLWRLKPSEITGPLANFQATEITEADVKRLVIDLNERLPEDRAVPHEHLEAAFRKFWPDLEASLASIPEDSQPRTERPERDILEEVLQATRALLGAASKPSPPIPPDQGSTATDVTAQVTVASGTARTDGFGARSS